MRGTLRHSGAAVAVLLFAACGESYSSVDDPVPVEAGSPDVTAVDASSPLLDAGPDVADAAVVCDPKQPFSTILPLGGVNTGFSEGLGRLTPDELGIYFASQPGATDLDLYSATRADARAPFELPKFLGQLSSAGQDVNPNVSDDGLFLVFDSSRNGRRQIFYATRSKISDPFGGPLLLSGTDGTGDDQHPFLDGSELWFVSTRDGTHDLFHASVANGIATGVAPVDGMNTNAAEYTPVVSRDGLTLMFSSNRAVAGAKGGFDIFVSRRASRSSPFGLPALAPELNTASNDYPGWLSPDGCRLYFLSDRSGNEDLWIASK